MKNLATTTAIILFAFSLQTSAAESKETKTASGLVITMLKDGSGVSPRSSDTVKVHYRGTLPDGKEFDSSYGRGQPATFPLNRVIPCWTEGVQLMKTGGKAKLVAYIGGNSRYPGLPEIPGIGESSPSFEKPPSWFAFWGPAGMPQPIVTRWNAEIVKAMNSPEGLAWLETNGGYVYGGPPERLSQMMREGTEIYRKIVTTAGLKPE